MDYREIYDRHADRYEDLVAAEDCDGNLLPALAAIVPLRGAAVLEVGVGTGRITRLLAPVTRRIEGVERSESMLAIARRHLGGVAHCTLHCADAAALPVPSGWADVAVAGWVFGHFRAWLPGGWRDATAGALAEMRRALRPDGTTVVIETLGTGRTEPAAPSPELAEYYAWLERDQGFARTAIRTDYQFVDVARAAEVAGFFFGDAFGRRVEAERWSRIPECTGLWWRRG